MRKAFTAPGAGRRRCNQRLRRLARTHATPDEFAVARNAPLVIPPDFSLSPPVAGTAALSAGDAQQQAIDALFGGPAPRSAGETSLLDAAGREQRAGRHPLDRLGPRHADRRQGPDDVADPLRRRRRTATSPRPRPGNDDRSGANRRMVEDTLSARLVEIESMLDRSRRRFEEGSSWSRKRTSCSATSSRR